MATLPTGTVTMMFTDIEGSTRLLREHGDQFAALLLDHQRRLRAAATARGGVEVNTQGDAFFFAFTDAAAGVDAAVAMQESLSDGPVQVRIGLHTGTPQVVIDDYAGIDVHRAARICSAAHGGQVVISDATRALAGARHSITDLGRHRLKDLTEPERLFQVGTGQFPPLRSMGATNLPALASPVVGREQEAASLWALIGQHRLVTITGPGGTGKTTLAIAVARQVAADFPDGVFWVPLAGTTDAHAVPSIIRQTLGGAGPLAEFIAEKRLMLVLDNLEQVTEYGPDLAALVAGCPHLHVLTTSRVALRLSVERRFELDVLQLEDAVQLFGQRAVVATPLELVIAICQRVDRLPLAIELAAARTSDMSLDLLAARLTQALQELESEFGDVPSRHRTLRATIQWSWDLLSAGDRTALAAVSVFAGGFDVAAAEAVCSVDARGLESLIRQSLLRRSDGGRSFLLETVREFAEEMLGAEQADHEMARRHAEFFLERAMSANLTADAEGAMRHDIVLRDQANIRRAIEWCRASGEFELGLRLAVALENYWSTSAPEEGRRWLSEFLDQGPDLPTALRAAARRARGGSSILLGDRALGRIEYEASLADARASGDARVTSLMLERLAIEDIVDGEVARGRARCEEGLALARSIGFGKPEAMALNILGSLERAAGHAHEGASLLQQSADLAGQVGFTWWQSSTLLELAEAYLEDGDVAAAERALLEALPLLADMADRQNTVYTLAVLARCAAEQGDLERAGWLWGAVEAEEARGRVGQWEQDRDSYAAAVLKHATAEFDTARTNGAAADLTEAIEFALGRGRGAEEGRRPRHELDRAATGQDAL